jgi:homoserine kinase
MRNSAAAFAPGSVGNVGPGLDIFGLAIAGAGDTVEIAWHTGHGIVVADPGHPDLPTDPARHTAAIGAASVLARLGVTRGVTIRVRKGLPLAGGQGGSAASAVAGAAAANALAGGSLDSGALLECALEAEAVVAGHHADNVAPSLLGGWVLIRSTTPLDVVAVPVPAALQVVLVHPEQRLATRQARAVLPATVPRDVALQQAANVAAMVAAAACGDLALLGRALVDGIAEPARRALLPGFDAAKRAAIGAGALGCSISGAGPTIFALVDSSETGARVRDAMARSYRDAGVPADGRVADIDLVGVRVQ